MPNFALPHKAGPRQNWSNLALCCGSASSTGKKRTTCVHFAQRHCPAVTFRRRAGGNCLTLWQPEKPAVDEMAAMPSNVASASDQAARSSAAPDRQRRAVTLPTFLFGFYLNYTGERAHSCYWKYFAKIRNCCGFRPRPQLSGLLIQNYHLVRNVILLLRDGGHHGIILVVRNGHHFIAAPMPRLSRGLRSKCCQCGDEQNSKKYSHEISSRRILHR
jgi:hypothetical protein